MKYGEVKIDTTGIRDIDCDGGFSADDLVKMISPDYAINQCGEIKTKGENDNE